MWVCLIIVIAHISTIKHLSNQCLPEWQHLDNNKKKRKQCQSGDSARLQNSEMPLIQFSPILSSNSIIESTVHFTCILMCRVCVMDLSPGIFDVWMTWHHSDLRAWVTRWLYFAVFVRCIFVVAAMFMYLYSVAKFLCAVSFSQLCCGLVHPHKQFVGVVIYVVVIIRKWCSLKGQLPTRRHRCVYVYCILIISIVHDVTMSPAKIRTNEDYFIMCIIFAYLHLWKPSFICL